MDKLFQPKGKIFPCVGPQSMALKFSCRLELKTADSEKLQSDLF